MKGRTLTVLSVESGIQGMESSLGNSGGHAHPRLPAPRPVFLLTRQGAHRTVLKGAMVIFLVAPRRNQAALGEAH